jgi:hypothetical protein
MAYVNRANSSRDTIDVEADVEEVNIEEVNDEAASR